eukprot:TRINITY_DN3398_c0_g1_i3.p1 TRINITY_DN3398_c0_g1~~TRINITY_DN3398_c0_g1_i3.p1  ORF type:complete len:124 (+),score=20.26 TRINITY_DN3398_c0_g1_i3:101-472(+)
MYPLHAAALIGNSQATQILLEHGAKPELKSWNGFPRENGAENSLTAQDYAVFGGDLRTLAIFNPPWLQLEYQPLRLFCVSRLAERFAVIQGNLNFQQLPTHVRDEVEAESIASVGKVKQRWLR